MKLLDYIIWGLIGLFIFLFVSSVTFFQHIDKQLKERKDTVVVYKYDTVLKVIAAPAPQVTDTVYYPVPVEADTSLILQRYFTKFSYSQTLQDSSLEATIHDTIWQNKIIARNFSYKLLKPVLINQIISKDFDARNSLYLGLFGGAKNAGANLFYTIRQNVGFSLGYDFSASSLVAGAFYKIR
jgi:isoleucyl-tRNA synthetase